MRLPKELKEETFYEILRQIKPMLVQERGCSESQIKEQFRSMKGSVIETFLATAIQHKIIREITSGMFKLIRDPKDDTKSSRSVKKKR